MKDKNFTFTVIIPVYNVEEYIGRTIESVIGQTVGFTDNIQLILVNDGSSDGSGAVCQSYGERYPDNIIYIEKENGGVSSARNLGMQFAEGKFVNFLDSDDLWDANAFSAVLDFITGHGDIRIISCRMLMFGRRDKETYHLDYEYDKTKVIDLHKTYDHPLLSVARSFIDRELLEGRRFDENLAISEDMLFLNSILLETGRYGLIREAVYWYRKRDDNSSALDTSMRRKDYYTATPKLAFKPLIESSEELYGEVIPYIQYLLITDLQWRIKRPLPEGVLTDSEVEQYRDTIRFILSRIDDKYILAQRHMGVWYKNYVLKVKHGEAHFLSDESLKQELIGILSMNTTVHVMGDELIISGRANEKCICSDYRVCVKDNGNTIGYMYYEEYPAYNISGLFPEADSKGYIRQMRLPLKKGARYSFWIEDDKGRQKKLGLKFSKNSRLIKMQDSLLRSGKYIVKQSRNEICVYDFRLRTWLASERRYEKVLSKKVGVHVASLRRSMLRRRVMTRKNIWIIDGLSGDTRAQSLACYIAEKRIVAEVYLLKKERGIDSNIGDNKKGVHFVEAGSDEHMKVLAAADAIFSFSTDRKITMPLGDDMIYYNDIIDCKSVCISGNITETDMMDELHYLKSDIDLLILSTDNDQKTALGINAGFDKGNVKIVPPMKAEQTDDIVRWNREIAEICIQLIHNDKVN